MRVKEYMEGYVPLAGTLWLSSPVVAAPRDFFDGPVREISGAVAK